MGLPQPIATALDEMESEAQSAAHSSTAETLADYERAANDLASSLTRLERRTQAVREAGAAWVEKLTGSPTGESLDEAIEYLRSHEERLAEIVEPVLESGREALRQAFQIPKHLRARAHGLSTRTLRVHAEAIEAVRDMRWKLLAVRSLTEDPGDHPILDSPEALESYLDRNL
jgi:prefoldin subunit 5